MHKNALGTGIAIYHVFYYASTLPCHDYLANASNNSRKILTDLLSEGINLSFHQMWILFLSEIGKVERVAFSDEKRRRQIETSQSVFAFVLTQV